MSRPAAFLITDAYPGTPCQGLRRSTGCQGLRRSTGHCPTPALYVIDVGGIVHPVCGGHLWAFKRELGL
jgi:hypothetical protein